LDRLALVILTFGNKIGQYLRSWLRNDFRSLLKRDFFEGNQMLEFPFLGGTAYHSVKLAS
jgi:hypothetical protein